MGEVSTPTDLSHSNLNTGFDADGVCWLNGYEIACLVHQSLSALAQTYLADDIDFVGRQWPLPSPTSSRQDSVVARTHNTFGIFAATAPWVWNNLPYHLRQDISYRQFRRQLKTFTSWIAKLFIRRVPPRFGGAIWWMLARWRPTWRRLFLAAYPSGLNLVVAVLRDSVYVCHCCPAWQTVCCIACKVEGFIVSIILNEDYYYYYFCLEVSWARPIVTACSCAKQS